MTDKRRYVRYVSPELWEAVNPDNKDLLDKFLMGKRNLSDTSRAAYFNDLQSFFVYVLKHHDNRFLLDFDVEDAAEIIDDYISFCMSVLGNSERRASRKTSSISSLYIFYRKRRKIKENPVELLERVRAVAGQYVAEHIFLTMEQVEQVRKGLKESGDTQLELYFEFALFTMARVSAISSIEISQIDLANKIVKGVREKESYIVDFFISDRVKNLIEKWIAERSERSLNSELLFCTRSGRNAKANMQIAYAKKLSEYAGVNGVTPHCLRRTGANLRRDAGMSLENVSKLLNHKSTAVTQAHYLQENFKKLQEEAEKFDI